MVISDICNTLADINSSLRRVFGVSLDAYPAPVSRDFWESETGLTVLYKATAISGAAECLRGLARKLGGPVYITCRPQKAELITRRWLTQHGFPEAPIYFCRDAHEKAAVAARLNASIALEDDPRVVRLYVKSGITVLVPDWPYNRSLDVPNAVRMTGVVENGYG